MSWRSPSVESTVSRGSSTSHRLLSTARLPPADTAPAPSLWRRRRAATRSRWRHSPMSRCRTSQRNRAVGTSLTVAKGNCPKKRARQRTRKPEHSIAVSFSQLSRPFSYTLGGSYLCCAYMTENSQSYQTLVNLFAYARTNARSHCFSMGSKSTNRYV